MTDLDTIYKYGDRVRATYNKDTVEVYEFTVGYVGELGVYADTGLYFYGADWDFEKLAQPLQTGGHAEAALAQLSAAEKYAEAGLCTSDGGPVIDVVAVAQVHAILALAESIQGKTS